MSGYAPAVKSAPARRAFVFTEVKTIDDENGIFEGYLSVFGNADSYKDIVDPGSFTKTIKDHENARQSRSDPYLFPILWQHNPTEPIGGFLNVNETPKGLFVKAQLDLDIEEGRRAYSGLKKGYVNGLSIGYDTVKEQFKAGFRHLKEIRLWEGSIVTFGANELALVSRIKAAETKGASGKTSWSIADRDATWDGGAATKRIRSWANGDNGKMAGCFMWHSTDNKQWKFPFCDIHNGSPTIIPKAVFSIAGALRGARGGAKIPSSDIGGIKSRVNALYRKMAKKFNDPTLKPPWAKSFDDLILDFKARDFDTVNADRAIYNLADDLYDNISAFTTSMIETLYDDDETDKSSLICDSCDQFKNAMIGWADNVQSITGGYVPDDGDDDTTDENDMSGEEGDTSVSANSVSSGDEPEASTSPYGMEVSDTNGMPRSSPARVLASTDIGMRMVKWSHASLMEELKAGRTISSQTRIKIQAAIEQMSEALSGLNDLLGKTDQKDDNEDDDTSSNQDDEPDNQDSKPKATTPTTEVVDGPPFLALLAQAVANSQTPSKKSEPFTSPLEEFVKQMREEAQKIVIS